jgi:hypothetical protein
VAQGCVWLGIDDGLSSGLVGLVTDFVVVDFFLLLLLLMMLLLLLLLFRVVVCLIAG